MKSIHGKPLGLHNAYLFVGEHFDDTNKVREACAKYGVKESTLYCYCKSNSKSAVEAQEEAIPLPLSAQICLESIAQNTWNSIPKIDDLTDQMNSIIDRIERGEAAYSELRDTISKVQRCVKLKDEIHRKVSKHRRLQKNLLWAGHRKRQQEKQEANTPRSRRRATVMDNVHSAHQQERADLASPYTTVVVNTPGRVEVTITGGNYIPSQEAVMAPTQQRHLPDQS